ncbi:beta-lactamase family protein [Metarhizium rileyi]|uniref:Beta-lactamase family protein n=1 Tax=Metarhizium rileyi (strain RCEF 4871) TaxID=1649241 RepID=A0A162JE67_METRR|nr:beta-lactamase family protein [Metarhizium rileyi RCEF 4871]
MISQRPPGGKKVYNEYLRSVVRFAPIPLDRLQQSSTAGRRDRSYPDRTNLSSSSTLNEAGENLTKTLYDALKGVIEAGWPVDNLSFSLSKQLWTLTMGQYTTAFGSTVRLSPTELSQTTQMNGKNAAVEIWRLWLEFGQPTESEMPGSSLEHENCLQWTLGDWFHYGKEPLDRVIFYKYKDQLVVVGFEMPFLRSGILKPT